MCRIETNDREVEILRGKDLDDSLFIYCYKRITNKAKFKKKIKVINSFKCLKLCMQVEGQREEVEIL